MRKLLLAAALLAGGFLVSGSTAQAATGCACATLTAAPVCTSGISSCLAMGGACVLPCDYKEPKMRHHRKYKHHRKMKMKK